MWPHHLSLFWAYPPPRTMGDASVMEQMSPTRHLQAAHEAMRLTPQEIALYMRHLGNLYGPGGFNQPDGARSTLLAGMFGIDGRTYVMPTIHGGRVLQPGTPEYRAFIGSQGGPQIFPSYGSFEEADARYRRLHDFFERDTQDYQSGLRR